MAIPKIIHQIWLQGWDKLPAKFQSNVRSVLVNNPNWQHKAWDEKLIIPLLESMGGQST